MSTYRCRNCGYEISVEDDVLISRCNKCGANISVFDAIIPIKDSGERRESELNVEHHMSIVSEMNKLYERKNKDYGDSFHLSFLEEGMAMARIRLSDKLNRFKTLTKADKQEVKDESVRDTLIDLANYAVMTVMELDRKGE